MLQHGNTVLLQDFEASGVTGMLAEDHRVISFDRPGFGYSERRRNRLWTAQRRRPCYSVRSNCLAPTGQ